MEDKKKFVFSDFLKSLTKKKKQNGKLNITFLALSTVSLLFFICLRFVWAFSGISIMPMIILSIAALAICIVAWNFEIPIWLFWKGCFFAICGLIFDLIMCAVNLLDFPHTWNYIVEMIPLIFAIVLSVGGYFFVKHYKRKAIAGFVVITLAATFTLCFLYNIFPIWFKTGPVVFDAGDEGYVVEFITNVDGLGFVEVKEGANTKTYFAVSDGRKMTDTTIHKVAVPKSVLEGAEYRIGCSQNIVPTKNKNYWGATIRGDWKRFKTISTDDVKYLAASDIHSQFGGAIKISRELQDSLDFLVVLGDSISFIHTRSDIENILIKGMADMSNGEIPVYYIRGNHETMGSNPQFLKDYIVTPTGEFYYTFSYHNFFAVVLDSGDGNALGTTRDQVGSFEPFLQKQTAWLQDVLQSGKYQTFMHKAAIVHIPLDTTDQDLTSAFADWNSILSTIGIDYSISGHTHHYKISAPDSLNFTRIQTGGKGEKLYTYTCVAVTMSSNDTLIERYDEKGVRFLQENI